MPPQAKQMMNSLGFGPNGITMVMYGSGKKTRVDFGNLMSAIADRATTHVIMINRMMHTYNTMPSSSAAGAPRATYKPTGRTKIILGHLCREYTGTSNTPNGGTSKVDAWTTTDLPSMPFASSLGSGDIPSGLTGVPLAMTAVSTGPMGPMTVHVHATSISSAPLPTSVFAVPSGYTQSAGGGMFPGMGGQAQ
jgi:hypothetical protein